MAYYQLQSKCLCTLSSFMSIRSGHAVFGAAEAFHGMMLIWPITNCNQSACALLAVSCAYGQVMLSLELLRRFME